MTAVLVQIFVASELEATFEQVSNVAGIRRYCHKHGKTLPGDIALQIEQAKDGGWLISVLDDPGQANA